MDLERNISSIAMNKEAEGMRGDALVFCWFMDRILCTNHIFKVLPSECIWVF
jgi:hypothetical protein